jgi:DNA repair exonuclease SbcCD nuclease subunit
MQYGLEARRSDFAQAFQEVVEKTMELKPSLLVIAGDLFNEPRPSNPTLATALKGLRMLKESGIKVLVVDGSHDSAPNVTTGTILRPLQNAGLLTYLPSLPGSSWQNDCCYVYGLPNFRTRAKVMEKLDERFAANPPKPDPDLFNIFLFHQAIDDPELKPPYMEAEIKPDQIPNGFNYYAGGHVHKFYKKNFKSGVLVYSGTVETTTYLEAELEKGFCFIQVSGDGSFEVQRIKLEKTRSFIVLTPDCAGLSPTDITERTCKLVSLNDKAEAIIAVALNGSLPPGVSKGDVDVSKIRRAAQKALYVHVVNNLEETSVSGETLKAIFEEAEDRREKAYRYFLTMFGARYVKEDAEKLAKIAVELIDPLVKGERDKVKKILEEAV